MPKCEMPWLRNAGQQLFPGPVTQATVIGAHGSNHLGTYSRGPQWIAHRPVQSTAWRCQWWPGAEFDWVDSTKGNTVRGILSLGPASRCPPPPPKQKKPGRLWWMNRRPSRIPHRNYAMGAPDCCPSLHVCNIIIICT